MGGRLFSLLLVCAFASSAVCAPANAHTASAPEPADRSAMLAGTWTCRTAFDAQTRHVGTLSGTTLEVVNDVQPAEGNAYQLDDVYRYDDVADRWHVTFGAGAPIAIDATAPRWTDGPWDMMGRDRAGHAMRVRFDLLPEGTLRRTFFREVPPSGAWSAFSAELCSPGDDPPPADACIISDLAPSTIFAAPVDVRDVPRPMPRGIVNIVVTLDANSQIVSTAVQSAPFVSLVPAAMRAARASRFHTVIRDCRPQPGAFIFSVHFGA